MAERGPRISEIMAAAEGAHMLSREQLLGLGAVARWPRAWAALLDIHAKNLCDLDHWGLTLTTRIDEADFWALPVGDAPLQEAAGQPVYRDDHGGTWVLQFAPARGVYRRRKP
jgi:hypothetical protein